MHSWSWFVWLKRQRFTIDYKNEWGWQVRERLILISISTSFCSRFTLIGVNLNRCDRGKPEVYANLLWSEVTKWIKALSEPFQESSICNRAATIPSEISIKNTNKKFIQIWPILLWSSGKGKGIGLTRKSLKGHLLIIDCRLSISISRCFTLNLVASPSHHHPEVS